MYHDEQCVVVTVSLYRNHVQKVSAFFSFGPQTVFGTAEESHLTRFHGFLVGFLVHESQHQYFLRIVILDNGRNQAIHFFKIQFHNLTLYNIVSLNSYLRTAIPSLQR